MKLLYSHALWLAWLSEAYWRAGRLEDAPNSLDGPSISREIVRSEILVWALCLLGEIAAERDPLEVEQAEDHHRQALALAEAWHAPAQGPLSPRPRHLVYQGRPTGRTRRTIHRHRAIPCHGDDVLAPPEGGAGRGGEALSTCADRSDGIWLPTKPLVA